ncbi:hypothetical protein IQ781_27515 (plasmid) [Bacillus sp. N447-1]|uniref:hypothetical protein n=1 Tax=Bacillus sp. N447-1 TaxID=2789208 RepID=UPI001F6204D1|nr:hypothetical protein [Bacillus sp. N447-1]UNT71725.1 hypothetical protein IQ781_27515 [Bacillus sp. N447-1]
MSNRNIADLFGDSASRTDNVNETEVKHNDNKNETKQKHNVNETLMEQKQDYYETLTEQKQDYNETETKQTVNDVIENDDVLGFLNVNKKKTLVGFHLEDDINKVIKKVLGKNPGKGAQSELANRIFRDFFEKRGLL